MVRYSSIRDYTIDLRRELRGVDEALVVDAVDDANEHLEMMVEELIESGRTDSREKAIAIATRSYGSPKLIAKEYITNDSEIKEKMERKKQIREKETLRQSIFNVYKDPYTYLGLIYFFLLFFLGIFYFVYIITMVSVGFGLAITIIGLPLLFLFLLSVYPISWFHGRMTEAMLGIRLPKKPRRMMVRGTPWKKVKTILKDPRLYSSVIYLFLMFPLGIIYFTVILTFMSVSILLFISPILALFDMIAGYPVGLPGEPSFLILQVIFGWLLGFVVLTWTLHLSNMFGSIQGGMSRCLLLKR
jgi:uncharacterized membrane protein